MKKLGIVLPSGVLDGSVGVGEDTAMNMQAICIVGIGRVHEALEYSFWRLYEDGLSEGWKATVNACRQRENDSPHLRYRRGLFEARLEATKALPDSLRWLFSKPFPVLYGFSLRPGAIVLRHGETSTHTLVASNLSPQELRLVLVPKEWVAPVKEIMDKFGGSAEILVRGIEDTNRPFANERALFCEFALIFKLIGMSNADFDRFIEKMITVRSPPWGICLRHH